MSDFDVDIKYVRAFVWPKVYAFHGHVFLFFKNYLYRSFKKMSPVLLFM